MALRLLELTLPNADLPRIPALFEEIGVVHSWTSVSSNDTGLVRVLLDAQDTEALSDLLAQHFGTRDKFRITTFTVEATIPSIKEPPKEEPVQAEEASPAKGGAKRISVDRDARRAPGSYVIELFAFGVMLIL